MRKLLIILVAVIAASLVLTAVVQAAQCTTKPGIHKNAKMTHKATVAHKAKMVKHCKAMPARAARGPRFACPAPVVNVPAQAAPVVNVPSQPAPVVNVAAPPPGVAVSSDYNNIYVLRGDQLYVLDKQCYGVRQIIPLPPPGTATTSGTMQTTP